MGTIISRLPRSLKRKTTLALSTNRTLERRRMDTKNCWSDFRRFSIQSNCHAAQKWVRKIEKWANTVEEIERDLYAKLEIHIGETTFLVHANTFQGDKLVLNATDLYYLILFTLNWGRGEKLKLFEWWWHNKRFKEEEKKDDEPLQIERDIEEKKGLLSSKIIPLAYKSL